MENTSDSLMPRPLLLCLKSEKIVCYSVPDNSMTMSFHSNDHLENCVKHGQVVVSCIFETF